MPSTEELKGSELDPVVNLEAERYIPVAKPTVGDAERQAVLGCLSRQQLSGGWAVEEFEQEFAAAHDMPHGVACNSGTSALLLALRAAGLDPLAPRHTQLVLCPTMTMVAVPNAIIMAGGTPVFVDSERQTGNVDIYKVREAIDRLHAPWVKAAIYVHLYGVPCEFERIGGVVAIEDACESHYARFRGGKSVGSRGDFACFSFYANKIVCAGEGGMVLCRGMVLAEDRYIGKLVGHDDSVARRLRSLRAHAFTPGNHFNHQEHAYGVRMTELSGAIGLAQHRQRLEFLIRRNDIAMDYSLRFAASPFDEVFHLDHPSNASWWVYPVLFRNRRIRDLVRNQLAEDGVETRTFFRPMHQQGFLKQFCRGQSFPVADSLFERGLYLPLYPSLTEDDIEYVCSSIRKALRSI